MAKINQDLLSGSKAESNLHRTFMEDCVLLARKKIRMAVEWALLYSKEWPCGIVE